MPIYVRADIQGIDKLQAKLRGSDIYAGPWRKALTQTVEDVLAKLREAAPHNRNTLDAAFTYRLDARPVPEWGIITNDATGAKGYRYPWALNASDRYHYRHGPRTGRSTKGWFTATFARTRSHVDKLLNEAAREIERLWQA